MVCITNFWKVHPFTPFPMMICVEFLLAQKNANERGSLQAAEVWWEMQSLSSVNNLARTLSARVQLQSWM